MTLQRWRKEEMELPSSLSKKSSRFQFQSLLGGTVMTKKKVVEKKSASQRRVTARVMGYAKKKKAVKKVNTIPGTDVSVVPDTDQDPDLYARTKGE